MEKLAQLQATLREIENGVRLESLDTILVRQVLQQAPPPNANKSKNQSKLPSGKPLREAETVDDASTALGIESSVSGKDAYRVLLELRRNKKKLGVKSEKQPVNPKKDGGEEASAEHNQQQAKPSPSPRLKPALLPGKREAAVSPEAFTVSASQMFKTQYVLPTDREMQIAIKVRGKELFRSQLQVEKATAQLQSLLLESQAILPNQFLFECNLKDFCQERSLEVIQSLLRKFQNRFYALYFVKWCTVMLALRSIAHRRAAAMIVRVCRGHCARELAKLVRKQLLQRQNQAQTLLDFRIKYRVHQALKIQMVWRRYLRSKAIQARQQRKQSAVYLQKLFRDRKLKRNQLVHTLLHVKTIHAVIKIQKLYRGHRTRRMVQRRHRQQQREALVATILKRNLTSEALLQWKMDRQGAAFLICSRALYPFALKRRMQKLVYLARRQRAAQVIARRVCLWFGVTKRREQAAQRQLQKWFRVLAVEQQRGRKAAILIQRNLRRWVQQRKFIMETTRRKKLARRQRIADKEGLKMRNKSVKALQRNTSSSSLGLLSKSSSPKVAKKPKFVSALKAIALRDSSKQELHSETRIQAEAISKIQRCYRRHTHHTKFWKAHWRDQAFQVELRMLRRRKAAITIQKRARGAQARRVFRTLKAQKLLYSFIMAWKWRKVIKFAQAARKIYRWIKHKRSQQIASLWRITRHQQIVMATRIQRVVRRRLVFRSKLSAVLAKARKMDETEAFCHQALRVCTQHFTDELIFASLSRPFEESMKVYLQTQHGQSTASPKSKTQLVKKTSASTTTTAAANRVAFPMMQTVFLVVSGAKDSTKWKDVDEKALLQTKLDRSRVVALFKAVNKYYQDNHHNINKSSPTKAKIKAHSSTIAMVTFFSMTDVDLALAKAGGASKRALTYEEFTKVLRLLAEMKLSARVTLWWSKYDGSDAQLLSLLWDFLFVLPELKPLVVQLQKFVAQVLHKRCERIQQLFQRGNNLKRGLLLRLQMLKQLEAQAQARAVIILQARVRTLLAKKQLRLRIQQVYEKYIDPEWGLPYWTNPKSGFSTWEKPRALRAEDVCTEVVPFPLTSLMLKIACEGETECLKCAEWLCYDCQEFFCGGCLPTFHKTSKNKITIESLVSKVDDTAVDAGLQANQAKASHEMEKITLCGLCQFQVASRKCLSCLPKPGHRRQHLKKKQPSTLALESSLKSTSDSSTVGDPEREAHFCDVCFAFVHRRGALQVHKSIELLEMCQSCNRESDEDGVAQELEPGPSKKLTVAVVVIPAPARVVQFECSSCDTSKRVCGKCVFTGHPIELCGEAAVKKTQLQTLKMLERAKRIAEEIEAHDRADVEKMKQRALEAKRKRCAVKIQKFWHAKVPILRARHVVAKRKAAKQQHWLRLKEDAKHEKQLVYLVRSFFGVAKPLQTDTQVKRKLREMNALQRRQLTIRARMFGLLAHEYMRVGIPLPGVARIMMNGSNELLTSEDLRGWVKNRQTIRLKRIIIDPQMKRERALENLSAWFHLSHWDHSDPVAAGGDSGSREIGGEETLVDVDAKEKLTERTIPLAQPLMTSGGVSTVQSTTETERDENGEDAPQEHVFVMYLVEYSMDPRRVVWINHSLYVLAAAVTLAISVYLCPSHSLNLCTCGCWCATGRSASGPGDDSGCWTRRRPSSVQRRRRSGKRVLRLTLVRLL